MCLSGLINVRKLHWTITMGHLKIGFQEVDVKINVKYLWSTESLPEGKFKSL